jgi:hypothetical protein
LGSNPNFQTYTQFSGTDILKDISPDPMHLAECNFEYRFQLKPRNNTPPQSLGIIPNKPITFLPPADALEEKNPYVDFACEGAYIFCSPPTTPLGIFGTAMTITGKGLKIVYKKTENPLHNVLGSAFEMIGSAVGIASNVPDVNKGLLHPSNLEKTHDLGDSIGSLNDNFEGISESLIGFIGTTRSENGRDCNKREAFYIDGCPIFLPQDSIAFDVKETIEELSKTQNVFSNIQPKTYFSVDILRDATGRFSASITYIFRTGFEYYSSTAKNFALPPVKTGRVYQYVILCNLANRNRLCSVRDLLFEIGTNYFSHLIDYVRQNNLWIHFR